MSRIAKLWSNDQYKEQLLNLLFKAGLRYIFEDIEVIEKFLERRIEKQNEDDLKILKDLRKLYQKHGPSRNNIDDYIRSRESRANLRWKEIGQIDTLSVQSFKFTMYLDFGAGDCSMACLLGQKMNLPQYSIHAIDIEEWEGSIDEQNVYRNKCQFKTYNGKKLPYDDQLFDIVTAFQVLHHIPTLKKTLKELHRVMQIGGLLIIREHHCHNKKMRKLIEIEHMLHDQVFTLNVSTDEPFAEYRKRKELKNMIVSAGFMWQGKYFDRFSIWNPTNYYYEVYVKI